MYRYPRSRNWRNRIRNESRMFSLKLQTKASSWLWERTALQTLSMVLMRSSGFNAQVVPAPPPRPRCTWLPAVTVHISLLGLFLQPRKVPVPCGDEEMPGTHTPWEWQLLVIKDWQRWCLDTLSPPFRGTGSIGRETERKVQALAGECLVKILTLFCCPCVCMCKYIICM